MSTNHPRVAPERFDKDAAIAATQSATALRGAALAFGKPPVKPKPQVNTYSGNNGALAAATKVGGARSVNNGALLDGTLEGQRRGQLHIYDGPGRHINHVDDDQRYTARTGNGLLRPKPEQAKSASFLAANLAASRSPSVSPNVTGQQHQRPGTVGNWEGIAISRRSLSPLRSSGSSRGSDQPLDLTSIPPTTSLIHMFEQSQTESQARPALLAAQRSVSSSSYQNRTVPTQEHAAPPLKPSRPKDISSRYIVDPPRPVDTHKVAPILPRPHPTLNAKNDTEEASSDESFVSATDGRSMVRAKVDQPKRIASTSQHTANSAAAIDSLANAIVASSLASSRAASPSKSLRPPAPPSRRSPRGHHLYHGETSRSGSPSKPVGLRTTMRKPKLEKEPDEGAKRRMKKAHLMKKHPNKHHEGDRKRWRDEITERERRRYEAVWASNRGLHLSAGLESSVSNLVVRDIWSRSRLNSDILEEAYDLVNRTEGGSLGKEEFVVGLWLVDQRLKGRKLPIRVSDSVWHSVGVLRDMKMKTNKKPSKGR
ncbi:EF-hand [Glarea lozoyensis ATCC 20868]|uniref:EF-hand n=1 Tax=Glarea lozoyensis (strain ATCC 20868 / MF5171) TaxID=1116229 RepID=S3DC39_GLAL2|nr:EF-hand [Glarea lozoyensis ATCC 20868]EPE29566.1 EF-hand [Glarea lozoyensis ATCC 20868]